MRLKNVVRFALLGLTTGCGNAAGTPADAPAEPRSVEASPVAEEALPATTAAQPVLDDVSRDGTARILLAPALEENPVGFRPALSRAAPFWDQRPPAERITVSP